MVQLNLSGSFLHPTVGVNYLGIVLVCISDRFGCSDKMPGVGVENSPPMVQLMEFDATFSWHTSGTTSGINNTLW